MLCMQIISRIIYLKCMSKHIANFYYCLSSATAAEDELTCSFTSRFSFTFTSIAKMPERCTELHCYSNICSSIYIHM